MAHVMSKSSTANNKKCPETADQAQHLFPFGLSCLEPAAFSWCPLTEISDWHHQKKMVNPNGPTTFDGSPGFFLATAY